MGDEETKRLEGEEEKFGESRPNQRVLGRRVSARPRQRRLTGVQGWPHIHPRQ